MAVFPKFSSKYGAPIDPRPVPPERIAKYGALLPRPLLDHWAEAGWGGYGDGLIWTVDPDEFASVAEEWNLSGKAFIFSRTGLGALAYWDGTRAKFLDPRFGDTTGLWYDIESVFEATFVDDGFLDEVIDRPLFLEALPRLGRPASDECYGHVPALALGGEHSASSLQRVKLREHLAILRQMIGKA